MEQTSFIRSLTDKERAEFRTMIESHGSKLSRQVLDTILNSPKLCEQKKIRYHRQYQLNEKALSIASALLLTRVAQYPIDQQLGNSIKHLVASLFLEAKSLDRGIPAQNMKASSYAASGGHQLLELFLNHRQWLDGKPDSGDQRALLDSTMNCAMFCIKSQLRISDWIDGLYTTNCYESENQPEVEFGNPKKEIYSTLLLLCADSFHLGQASVLELATKCSEMIGPDTTFSDIERTLLRLWLAVIVAKRGAHRTAIQSLAAVQNLPLNNERVVAALCKLSMTFLLHKRDDLLQTVLRQIHEAHTSTSTQELPACLGYLEGFRLLLEREFKEARQSLQRLRLKFKGTMSICTRIMIAVCFHQEKDNDSFATCADNLFKSLSRSNANTAQTESVIRFFRLCVNHDCDAAKVLQKQPDYFEKMPEPHADSNELLLAIIPVQYLITTRCKMLVCGSLDN